MLNMCQISSLMAAAEGSVAEFSSFANLEEKKRKSNLLMSFPKIGNQMGSFGQIRKNSFFRFYWPILNIFGFTLLICLQDRFDHTFGRRHPMKLPLVSWYTMTFTTLEVLAISYLLHNRQVLFFETKTTPRPNIPSFKDAS